MYIKRVNVGSNSQIGINHALTSVLVMNKKKCPTSSLSLLPKPILQNFPSMCMVQGPVQSLFSHCTRYWVSDEQTPLSGIRGTFHFNGSSDLSPVTKREGRPKDQALRVIGKEHASRGDLRILPGIGWELAIRMVHSYQLWLRAAESYLQRIESTKSSQAGSSSGVIYNLKWIQRSSARRHEVTGDVRTDKSAHVDALK